MFRKMSRIIFVENFIYFLFVKQLSNLIDKNGEIGIQVNFNQNYEERGFTIILQNP